MRIPLLATRPRLGAKLVRGGDEVPYEHDFTYQNYLPQGFTFTRSGVALAWQNGLYVSKATDQPRFEDLDYLGFAGRRGLLMEGARTNLVVRSSVDGAGWGSQGCTMQSGLAGPVTGNAAVKIIETAASAAHGRVSAAFSVTSGQTYTIAAVIKAAGRSVAQLYCDFARGGNSGGKFDLTNGTATFVAGTTTGSAGILPLGSGWFFCWVTFVAIATGSAQQLISAATSMSDVINVVYLGDGSSGILCDYFGTENATFPSSPIPTAGSAVTRNAEACSRSVTLPSGGFTPVLEFVTPPALVSGYDPYVWEVRMDGNNRYGVYIEGSTGKLSPFCSVGGVYQVLGAYGSNIGASTRHRVAMRIAQDAFALWMDGSLIWSDTSISLWSGAATEYLGSHPSGSQQLFGHILRCNASPTRWRPPVSDAQLQALSALS